MPLAPVIVESPHEYLNNMSTATRVHMPGCVSMTVVFDPRSRTETGCDIVQLRASSLPASTQYSGSKFPGDIAAEKPQGASCFDASRALVIPERGCGARPCDTCSVKESRAHVTGCAVRRWTTTPGHQGRHVRGPVQERWLHNVLGWVLVAGDYHLQWHPHGSAASACMLLLNYTASSLNSLSS